MTNSFSAAQQVAFENLVTATAAAMALTRPVAIRRLVEQGIEPRTMPTA